VLGALGAGLGAGFRQEACSLGAALLDKLKDKNRGVRCHSKPAGAYSKKKIKGIIERGSLS